MGQEKIAFSCDSCLVTCSQTQGKGQLSSTAGLGYPSNPNMDNPSCGV